MVAVKHNWKRYLDPFFLALLREDLHRSNDGILERTMQINWLEPSEEDPLIYIVGDEDDKNPPQCILDIASVVQDGEKYFSNSLIIHKEKTKEITTVTVVWIPDLN